ncbi:MAG: GNAT family N-acetyltransferase [Treponema sp.]|nr:GNAT family N-acetyltransferase [Treponema sp.]
MQKISSWNELLKLVSEFRNKGCFINNFYPNESEMTVWIENGELFTESIGEYAYFFVHKTEIANFIYFFVKDLADIKIGLPQIRDELQTAVVAFDYICKDDEERKNIETVALSCGFKLRASLRRMSFVLKENFFEDEQEITFPVLEDVDTLLEMFNLAFDPVSERIPARERLKEYIEQKSILVCKKPGRIAGFAVVEIQKKNMYLKHLLTASDFRRQGIAEKLLKKAFFLSRGCVRFILWVINSNEPAINLYKKFGYKFEALSNYTYVSNG